MTEPSEDRALVVAEECAAADREFLSQRIYDFNAKTTGISDGRELAHAEVGRHEGCPVGYARIFPSRLL